MIEFLGGIFVGIILGRFFTRSADRAASVALIKTAVTTVRGWFKKTPPALIAGVVFLGKLINATRKAMRR